MKSRIFQWAATAAAFFWILPALAQTNPTPEEIKALAEQAYIYGYPLVLMDVSKEVLTNVPAPSPASGKAPVNQFGNKSTFPDASFHEVVSPNADTLYSSAWLDLSKEPIVLSVPDTGGRYYLMPMLDAWTNVFASPGSRTTGNGKQDFLISGPYWKGSPPPGMKEMKAPTSMVWIIGRTQTNGASDYAAVNALQKQYKLTPLSAWGKKYSPPTGLPVNPQIDEKTPPADQVAKMDAATFFNRLGKLLHENPPATPDAPMVKTLGKIHVQVGSEFHLKNFDAAGAKALQDGVNAGLARIVAEGKAPHAAAVNGWIFATDLGSYGVKYLFRAGVAWVGLGANLAADAVYPMARIDDQGQPLTGTHRYVIRFAKGEIPPVNAFWSITMYNNQQLFVANPLNRFAIGDRDKLKFNADGSLDIYLQNESPGAEKESNWLPAPKDAFNLIMRLYWPKPEVLNGTWKPPGVRRAP